MTVATVAVVTVLPPKLSRCAAVAPLFLKYGRVAEPDAESAVALTRDLEAQPIDHGDILEGLQKIANRISIGLVVAALIPAAALVIR